MADCEPFPFIRQNDLGKYCIDELAAKKIANIHKPLVVVVISGKMRTGKSFLMNALANISKDILNPSKKYVEKASTPMDGKKMETSKNEFKGFSVSPAVAAHTKGIWAWPIDHPLDPEKCLLMLDTEGLGDVGMVSRKNETWLSVIALILSSMYIWNIKGVIDTEHLEQLCFLTKMTEHIQTKVDSNGFDKNLLPKFVICIRDFELKLDRSNSDSAADDYVQKTLQDCIPGTSHLRDVGAFLNDNFKDRKCFTLPPPEDLENIDAISLNELDEAFFQSLDDISRHVLTEANVKFVNLTIFNGRVFVNTAEKYLQAHQEDKIAIGNTISSHVGELENKLAKENALQYYTQNMENSTVGLLPLSIEELSKNHLIFQKDAIKMFHQQSVLDREYKREIELLKSITEKYRTCVKLNSEMSKRKSKERLNALHEDIKNKIVKGEFNKPGGFKKYEEMMKKLEKDYHETASLGYQMHEVFHEFMQTKTEWLQIANADIKCSQKEKKIKDKQHTEDKKKYEQKAADMRKYIDGLTSDAENCQSQINCDEFDKKADFVASITGCDNAKEKMTHTEVLKLFGLGALTIGLLPFALAAGIVMLPALPFIILAFKTMDGEMLLKNKKSN